MPCRYSYPPTTGSLPAVRAGCPAWLVVIETHRVVERPEFVVAAQKVDDDLFVGDVGRDACRLEHLQRVGQETVGFSRAAGDPPGMAVADIPVFEPFFQGFLRSVSGYRNT